MDVYTVTCFSDWKQFKEEKNFKRCLLRTEIYIGHGPPDERWRGWNQLWPNVHLRSPTIPSPLPHELRFRYSTDIHLHVGTEAILVTSVSMGRWDHNPGPKPRWWRSFPSFPSYNSDQNVLQALVRFVLSPPSLDNPYLQGVTSGISLLEFILPNQPRLGCPV